MGMKLKRKSQWELALRCYGENIDIAELGKETLDEITCEIENGKVSGVADFYGEPLDWSFVCRVGILDYAVSEITAAAKKNVLYDLGKRRMKGWA